MAGEKTEQVAEDALPKDKASKIIPPLPDAYSMSVDIWDTPPKDSIRWFDNQLMKYVYFNNHEERGRYILKQFGVPDEWTDKLMKTFPNKKWTVITIQMFVYFFRSTPMDLPEAINAMKDFCSR